MSDAQPDMTSRRAFPWWIIPAVLVLGVAGGVAWLFRYQIERLVEPRPTAPPTLAPSAAAGSGANPAGQLYATGFEDEAALQDWELFDDGIISAQGAGGFLTVRVDSVVDAGGYSGLNYTLEDFVLEFDAEKVAGSDNNSFFVVFRLVDGQNYNRFDISSDGWYSLSKVRDGVQTVVSDWMQSGAIQTGGARNRVRVEAVGDTFRFAVNGEPLELCVSYEEGVQPIPIDGGCEGGELAPEWVNGDLPAGKIGLGAQAYTEFVDQQVTPAETAVRFDNVQVMAPPAE